MNASILKPNTKEVIVVTLTSNEVAIIGNALNLWRLEQINETGSCNANLAGLHREFLEFSDSFNKSK